MSVRFRLASAAVLTTILLASACGGSADVGEAETSSEASVATDPPAALASEPTTEPEATPAEPTATPAPEPEEIGDPQLSGDCQDAISIDEWDALFGTTIESVNGAGALCMVIYASDSVGQFNVWPERNHDRFFEDNARRLAEAEENGIVFDGGRGFVVDRSVAIVGDSGLIYSTGLPDNVELADVDAVLLEFADLYMTR